MLTPAFELSQDEAYLTIFIKAPFAKISDTEIFIDGTDFKFYSKPYYLRLNLPGRIVEDGQESAKYETEKGSFVIKVPKETEGEHFEGLDMLTKLLAPAGKTSAKQPLIEVLDSPDDVGAEGAQGFTFDGCGDDVGEDDFDWQLEQNPFVDELSVSGPKYGFANQRSDVFKRLQGELHDIIDLRDADGVSMSQRHSLRVEDEQANFDEDHYLADLYDDEHIKAILSFKPYWDRDYKRLRAGEKAADIVELTENEKEKMRKLPRKEYVLDSSEQQQVFLSLVDIIFAYAYNHHTTDGENTVESGWTICKLSPTLSWLETFTNLRDVLIACHRRCLIFPLYRHWKLCSRTLRDTIRIFSLGRRCLLKCLLEIHGLLIESDPRYVLNDLYITDYCVWIQSVSDRHIESLAKKLQQMVLEKSDVELDLPALEQAAEIAVEESKATNKIASGVDQLKLSDSTVDILSNKIEELDVSQSSTSENGTTGNSNVVKRQTSITNSTSKKQESSVKKDEDSDASSSDDESDASSESNSDSSNYYTDSDESSETDSSSDSDDDAEENENEANVNNKHVGDQKRPLIEVLSSTESSNTPKTGLNTQDNLVPEIECQAN